MEQIYVIMLVALGILAIIDLAVGVSNDAVNFLNSAIGSKAVSLRTILIVASIGIAVGAVFSSGMMEVARKGIFMPSEFYFNEIMIIFMAVMITDILLLDFFNTLGMPTSTTVSVVFELLGSAVVISVIKILNNGDSLGIIGKYINTEKATEIIIGILLSVVISFSIGAIVQYISRLLLTFNYEKKAKWVGAIFGGIALAAISYFIIIKGLKGTEFYEKIKPIIKDKTFLVLLVSAAFWTLFSFVIIQGFKKNIYKLVIIVGTFALALAFAGNDLVNFIGVPIAAWQSYGAWVDSGAPATGFAMSVLAEKVATPTLLLMIAGGIMVITLWISKKSMNVLETEQNLSRQGEGSEKYSSNIISRGIVRGAVILSNGISFLIPKSVQATIDGRFLAAEYKGKRSEQPMFDMVRASINLVVAAVLISIATSMKLPLSTTYVTFMVAMGTSFADRAWDRESAVYRIAGVLNVIGGWFFTAFAAFISAGIVAYLLYVGEIYAFFGLMILVAVLFYRSNQVHKAKMTEKEEIKKLNKEDIVSIHEVINESSDQISKIVSKTNKIYSAIVAGLSLQDLPSLKENKKSVKKLEKQVDELKNNVYYFIKNLDETSVEASKFYVLTLGHLQDIVQSISYISQSSHSHINNNHKQLKFNQIRDLKTVELEILELFKDIEDIFNSKNFSSIDRALTERKKVLETISDLIQKQITRIRTIENSPKNSKLYFGLLLETNDLVKATMNLLELFKEFNEYVEKK
ncbi:inorganic phosphate transporter [Flavobacterium sediminilitoris]|uniref:Phosphate transporter n=1 Tax=Flavobacterium sediminilitoris TaxID=2024526 RepID=A0ABY4HTD7_9FLAO|nr:MULTISPECIES: inorganic phosphate transporter [Flavobacterium]UOX35422.1 inorganic phosphate transporter [Flavobacterium sediminilitoris]